MTTTRTPSTRVMARTRGAASGILLMILGAWGALVPFIGPWFDFAFSPDKSWHWNAARGWLEVLPGAVAFVAGFLLVVSRSRGTTLVASWLGIAAGAWFVVGLPLAGTLHVGSPGTPTGGSQGLRALENLAYFYALGAVIIFVASAAFGRLSVVTLRDVRVAERREQAVAAESDAAARDTSARDTSARDSDGMPEEKSEVPNRDSHRHFRRHRHQEETAPAEQQQSVGAYPGQQYPPAQQYPQTQQYPAAPQSPTQPGGATAGPDDPRARG